MKYVLLLSLSYKKYKDKTSELTVKINDRLIDTIILDQDIGLKQVTMTTRDRENVETEHRQLRTDKVYYYEIEDSEILHEDRENKLSISVKNDNNNYTNGFMTKDSLLSIENIFFLPLALFDIGKIKKIRDRLWHGFWKEYNYSGVRNTRPDIGRLSKETLDSMKEFYITEYTVIDWEMKAKMEQKTTEHLQEKWLYYKFHAQKKGLWPGIVHPLEYVHTSSNQKILNYSQGCTIGGSFKVSLPISKKHKIYQIRQKNYKGPFMIDSSNFYGIMIEILKGSPDCTIINTCSVDHQ
jgi:hypothetical protein